MSEHDSLHDMPTGEWGVKSPELGDQLGGLYELTQFIGRGGMGQVWQARDLNVTSRLVAIKFLPTELRYHDEAIEQMRAAFDQIHRLTHQHIGKAFGLLVDARLGPYVVMDLVSGESLRRYASAYRRSHGSISVEHVVALLRPIASALDYAHGESVVHRDVKPENILVRTEPRLSSTLIDFGLAAEVRTTMRSVSRQPFDTRGTLPYMSSEQLKGKRPPAMDQYALAVVAYELLANSLPFDSDTNEGLIYLIHREDPDPISSLSTPVNDMLLKGLAKKPEDRFGSCLEFIDALSGSMSAKSPRVLTAPFGTEAARAGQEAFARWLRVPLEFPDEMGQKFRLIPPGEFSMGSTVSERDRMLKIYSNAKAEHFADEVQHHVRLTRPWYMAIHPVTVSQFKRFVTEAGYRTEAERNDGGWGWNEKTGQLEGPLPQYSWKNPGFPQSLDHPVVNVSWNDAVEYVAWLSRTLGRDYRLPSEAEWEFACRAGTTSAFWNGDDAESLTQVANIADVTLQKKLTKYPNIVFEKSSDGFAFTSPVGAFPANPFGLYDMHGNVLEWCIDWYDAEYYKRSPVENPVNKIESQYRVLRGGSWYHYARYCRSADRGRGTPSTRDFNIGLRVVCELR